MKKKLSKDFREVWCVDFEYREVSSNPPLVHCMVAREVLSGRLLRHWLPGHQSSPCPIPLGPDCLYVAYCETAELKCHLSLGWELPTNVMDLYVEFRCLTNGLPLPAGKGLLGALIHFGLTGVTYTNKEAMRNLAIRGLPFSDSEAQALSDYCQSDVDALVALLPFIIDNLHIQQSLLRGRYMKAVAMMENYGIPIDVKILDLLQKHWNSIKELLIQRVDQQYGVFEGSAFKSDLFTNYLERKKISWPRLPSGKLDLKDETFRQRSKTYPKISSLRELRHALDRLRLHQIEVGDDGRSRVNLRPYRSRTGRNQPSTAKYIFGNAKWLRGLIRPIDGWALAYIDWKQQEFGIAAALSGDLAMQKGYCSGDPYLEFSKQAGLVPENATKQTHPDQRRLCKAAVLSVHYGMGAESLATSINQSVQMGRELLAHHRRAFPKFWQWSEAAVDYALLYRKLWTVFGWQLHLGSEVNTRSLANFPMQANGAEILRLACCYMIEAGIRVCAPVHDAVLIEVPIRKMEEEISKAKMLMARASREVLSGFELGTDVVVFCYPERYCDEDRGKDFWEMVISEIDQLKNS